MKVYILVKENDLYRNIWGVYSSREKAEAAKFGVKDIYGDSIENSFAAEEWEVE